MKPGIPRLADIDFTSFFCRKREYVSNNLPVAKTRNETLHPRQCSRYYAHYQLRNAARTSERRQSIALCNSKDKRQDHPRSGNSWRWPCGRRTIVFRDNTRRAVLVARGIVKSGDRSGKCLGNASSFPFRKTRHRNEWRGKSEILRRRSSRIRSSMSPCAVRAALRAAQI